MCSDLDKKKSNWYRKSKEKWQSLEAHLSLYLLSFYLPDRSITSIVYMQTFALSFSHTNTSKFKNPKLNDTVKNRWYTFILNFTRHTQIRLLIVFMIYIFLFCILNLLCFMDRLKMLICVSAWPIRIYLYPMVCTYIFIWFLSADFSSFLRLNFASEWPVYRTN